MYAESTHRTREHDENTMRRLSGLSAQTRALIRRDFGNDIDEAEYVATKLQAQMARTPGWVSEVIGARSGWRDPMSWAARR